MTTQETGHLTGTRTRNTTWSGTSGLRPVTWARTRPRSAWKI